MSATSKPARSTAASAPSRGNAAPRRDPVQSWLLASFVMVCVARPLVPSEAVSWVGDGHAYTMLLLLIGTGYATLASWRGWLTRRFDAADALVVLLVAACALSSLLGMFSTMWGFGNNREFDLRHASPRLALNSLWEWVGLGMVFLLARQLIATAVETRAVVAVMLALAVVISALGLWQIGVTLPADRAAYAADPDTALKEVGQWFPADSPERKRFEDRLNSTEPTGTFALANSLAGFLAPWLVVGAGVAWSMRRRSRAAELLPLEQQPTETAPRQVARLALLGAGLATVLVCLVLTKSRSAYLATGVGFAVLPWTDAAFRRLWHWKVLAVAGVMLAIAIGAAFAAGGLDAEVATEAAKSLEYRTQYWQATLDMIAKFPMFGCGPGEFQDYYTLFKLPEASEEVRDPHNFVLEVWATAGTGAFVLLITFLAYVVWQVSELPETLDNEVPGSRDAIPYVASGAVGGVLFAWGAGLPFGFSMTPLQMCGAIALGAVMLAALWSWIATGKFPPRLAALGLLVLAINLLAAGGFTYPGVSGTFWLLAAITLNARTPATRGMFAPSLRTRWAPIAALALVVSLGAACYQTALLPVFSRKAAMAKSLEPNLTEDQRADALLAASQADPFSAEPWVALAQLAQAHVKRDPSSDFWGTRFAKSLGVVSNLRGQSSASWHQIATWYREIMDVVGPNPDIAARLVETSRTAAMLYPNSPTLQASYTMALVEAKKLPEARKVAERALELDSLTPHADKKLSAPLRESLKKLLAAQPPATPAKAADGTPEAPKQQAAPAKDGGEPPASRQPPATDVPPAPTTEKVPVVK